MKISLEKFGEINVLNLTNLPADLPFAHIDPRAGRNGL